jgi:hypothetical protein
MMKFMILVKSNPHLEKLISEMSESEMAASMAEMGKFNDELKKAGVMVDCDGLSVSRVGKRVRFEGASRTVVDGPFTGDLVAGYWIWELPSMEDAVAWVKRCPNPMPEASEIEIRPFWTDRSRQRRARASPARSAASVQVPPIRAGHPSERQRAMVAAKLANLPRGQDQSANLRNAPTGKQAATLLNVNPRWVETAKTVPRDAVPEVTQAVERGEVAVSAAAEFAKQSREQQAGAVATVEAGKAVQFRCRRLSFKLTGP